MMMNKRYVNDYKWTNNERTSDNEQTINERTINEQTMNEQWTKDEQTTNERGEWWQQQIALKLKKIIPT